MKDWLLIPVMVAVFAFGYYVVKRFDTFIEDNQRQTTTNARRLTPHIRIAAETPSLFDSISAALDDCSNAAPYFAFSLSCGTRKKILDKLSDGTLNIALLTEESMQNLGPAYRFIRIPLQAHASTSTRNIPIEDLDDGTCFAVVWDIHIACRERDRVIFMIENELCSLKSEYASYLAERPVKSPL